MKVNEETKVVKVTLEMTDHEAKALYGALYRMQSYHLNNGQGIPASRRAELAPDLNPLFTLFDMLRGYDS